MRNSSLSAAATLFAVALIAAPASAGPCQAGAPVRALDGPWCWQTGCPRVSQVKPGIRLSQQCVKNSAGQKINVYAVRAEYTRCELALRSSPPHSCQAGYVTTLDYGQNSGALVALNGDFGSGSCSGSDSQANGLYIHGYDKISDDTEGESFFAFNPADKKLVFDPYPSKVSAIPDSWKYAVGGRPSLVEKGANVAPTEDDPRCPTSMIPCTRHARSAIGRAAGQPGYVFLVVAEGDDIHHGDGVFGMRLREMGSLLRAMGARDAFNLDGGGSSGLFVRGRGVVNELEDPGPARHLVNHIGVFDGVSCAGVGDGDGDGDGDGGDDGDGGGGDGDGDGGSASSDAGAADTPGASDAGPVSESEMSGGGCAAGGHGQGAPSWPFIILAFAAVTRFRRAR
jgi:hypothetical protein